MLVDVLEDGRALEEGTREEHRHRRDGEFAKPYEAALGELVRS